MKARETMICWTPAVHTNDASAGMMALVPHPDRIGGESDKYLMTDLACWGHVRKMPDCELTPLVLSIAIKAMVRDGLSPETVHRAMSGLDEYRAVMDPE